ncbi:LysR substrate-binding domain-containing protein [Paraburkholderia sp. CI3]|uniref:LysR family transcriptional regulator n=1 Tax=Paraburkholderia sp. CI3 TaxID=2991060 RepID=UPI003D1A8217
MDYFSAIRAFLHAAELGSFSKAADKVGIKTSTVSRYINELEQDLGIALFNRSTRGLVTTEGGRVFREHALIVIKSLDEAREITASLNTSPRGLLRVTMPTSFGRRHVIRHLPDFMDRYPKIDIDAVVTDDVLNIIDSGIDLAIRIGVLPDSQLMARQLAVHRRIVCSSPAYLAQHGTPASPEELASHTTLRMPLSTDDTWYFVNRTHRTVPQEVSVRLQSRLRVNDTEAVLDLAIAGRGIALLPTWAIGPAFRKGKLVQILPEWEAQPTRAAPAVWGVYPPKKTVSSKVRAFLDFYAAIFGQEGYWES